MRNDDMRSLLPKILAAAVPSFPMKRLLPIFLVLAFPTMLPLCATKVSFRNHVQPILAKTGCP
jgi:hypothetical protein